MSRVLVIGAGVGGLACALRLRAAGHDVTVYEQSDVVGGKLGRYVRTTPQGVFRFDTGPGLLTLPQVFGDLFVTTGTTLTDELEPVPLDPVVRHVFADRSIVDTCTDHVEFQRRLTDWGGPTAAAQWHRLWRRAGKVWNASWRHVLRSPVDGLGSLAGLAWRINDLVSIGPAGPSAASVAPTWTIRGCGCSLTDTPRTLAPTLDGRRPHCWPSRTRS